MVGNPHNDAEKIYQQILELLAELAHAYAESPDDDEVELDDDSPHWSDQDIVDMIVEEASERGMDEEAAERVFKAISVLAKKARES